MEACAGMVWFSFNLPARLNAAVSDDEGAERCRVQMTPPKPPPAASMTTESAPGPVFHRSRSPGQVMLAALAAPTGHAFVRLRPVGE